MKVPDLRSNGESMAHPLNPKLCYLPEYLPHGCLEARLYYSWLLNTMGLNGTDPLVSILGFFCFPNRFVVCYYTIQVGWIHKCESWDMGGWPRSYPQNLDCVEVRPLMSLLFKGQLYFLKCFITIGLAKKFIQSFYKMIWEKPEQLFWPSQYK